MTVRQTTRQMGQNTVAIWMAALLQDLLITLKVVALDEASFSDTQNPKPVSYHIHSRWEALSA